MKKSNDYRTFYAIEQINAQYFAKQKHSVAVEIYTEEWEQMSVMMRPHTPNLSLDRMYADKFISLEQLVILREIERKRGIS